MSVHVPDSHVSLFSLADMRQRNELRGNVPAAALSSALEDDVRGAVSLGTPSNTALEKCGT